MDFLSAVTAPLRFAGGVIGSAFNFAGGLVGGALGLAGTVAIAPFALARGLFSPFFGSPEVVALHVPDKQEMADLRADVHARMAGVGYRQSFFYRGPEGVPPPQMEAGGSQPLFTSSEGQKFYPAGTRIDHQTGHPVEPLAQAPASPTRAFNPASQKPEGMDPGGPSPAPQAQQAAAPPPRRATPGGMG